MLGHGLEHLQAVLFRLTPLSKEGGEGGACFLLRRPAALHGTQLFHLGCPQQQRGGAIGRGASWRRQMLPAAAYKKRKQVARRLQRKNNKSIESIKIFVHGGASGCHRSSESASCSMQGQASFRQARQAATCGPFWRPRRSF